MIQYLTKTISFIALLLTFSCSSQKYDPNFWHQNFVDALEKKVGQHFSSVHNHGFAGDGNLLGTTKLNNGHKVYSYGSERCGFSFEVDPTSDVIVNVWEDTKKPDCYIVP